MGGNNDKFYLISDILDEVNSYILKFYERHEVPKELLVEKDLSAEIIGNILGTKVVAPEKGKEEKFT